MKSKFRWGIIGASEIANKFCDAIERIGECEVVAISSRSLDRAKQFAEKNRIGKAYGSYEEMLQNEKLDAVYIATATGDHYAACKLCAKYAFPFLCEKTMCVNSEQTIDVFRTMEEKQVFCMEAMWSRFLPMIQKAGEWVKNQKIGEIKFAEVSLGFCAPPGENNRFWNPKLGGGAAYDLLVYAYEIMRFLLDKPILNHNIMIVESKTGVDASDVLILQYEDSIAVLKASLETIMSEELIIYGTKGRIVIPNLLFGNEVVRYDNDSVCEEMYRDDETTNGFVYEIKEVVRCVREGRIESDIVPHSLTIDFVKICDEIIETEGIRE